MGMRKRERFDACAWSTLLGPDLVRVVDDLFLSLPVSPYTLMKFQYSARRVMFYATRAGWLDKVWNVVVVVVVLLLILLTQSGNRRYTTTDANKLIVMAWLGQTDG